MKWIVWTFAVLVGILVAVTVIGYLLPREHVATRAARYHQPPETIWAAITDVDSMPSWREGLKAVKHLPDRNGLPAHVEAGTCSQRRLDPRASEESCPLQASLRSERVICLLGSTPSCPRLVEI